MPDTQLTTPPFMPDPSLLPPSGDPFSEVLAMLTKMQQGQGAYVVPQESKLTTILNALAGGASVLASQDPGAALANLLQNRQKIQLERENAERARQNQIQTAMIQTAVDKARAVANQQGQARQTRLESSLKINEGKENVQRQQEIDLNRLDLAQREAIQNNDLANRFSSDVAVRSKREAMAKAAPELFAKGIEIQSLMQTLVPDMPRQIAESIARKQSGQEPPNYTPLENQWYNKFVQARNNDWKTDKDLARKVKESEITENEAQAQYYKNSKLQDRFMNALNTNLGNNLADSIDSQYFIGKDGNTYSDKQIKAMPQIQQMMLMPFTPLSPEQSMQEARKNIEKQKALQESLLPQNKTTNPMPDQPTTQLTPEQIYQDAKAKGRTDDQIKQILKVNNIPDDVINKLVVPSQPQFTIKEQENIVKGLEKQLKDTSYGAMSKRGETKERLRYAKEQLEKSRKQAGIK